MNQEQNKEQKTSISWYPGHMEKARRQMQESLKAVDMIIEVRDARMPMASANPLLQKMTAAKPRLIILAKSDLADPSATEKWIQFFQNEQTVCISAGRDNLYGHPAAETLQRLEHFGCTVYRTDRDGTITIRR